MRGALIASILIYTLAAGFAISELASKGSTSRAKQWVANPAVDGGRPVVSFVTPQGAAHGVLRPGDEIVAIDGESTFRNSYSVSVRLSTYPPGAKYRVDFLRHGDTRQATLAIAGSPSNLLNRVNMWLLLLLSFAFMSCEIGRAHV